MPVPPVWVAWAVWAACIKAQSVIRNAGDFPGVFMYDYQKMVAFSERATKWLGCQQRRENVAHREVVAHLLSVVIPGFFCVIPDFSLLPFPAFSLLSFPIFHFCHFPFFSIVITVFSLVIPAEAGIQDKRSPYVSLDLRVKPEDDKGGEIPAGPEDDRG